MDLEVRPLFSVITVSYNSSGTINETLLSIIGQSSNDFEYIVVDGSSIDNTLDILVKYASRFKERGICFNWISEPDQGIYDAMNKGIELSRGDWIVVINSDDFLSNNALEVVTKVIVDNPMAEVLFGNLNLIDEQSNFVEKIIPDLDLNKLNNTFSIFHPSIIVKRDLYLANGLYNLKYRLSADWDLMKRIYLKGHVFQYFDFSFANFRRGGSGSGFKVIHLTERFKIRHSPFRSGSLFYDFKDLLIFFYFRVFYKRSHF